MIWLAVDCRCKTALTGEIRGIADLPPALPSGVHSAFSLKVRVSSAIENAKTALTRLGDY